MEIGIDSFAAAFTEDDFRQESGTGHSGTSRRESFGYNVILRRRSALPITDTELKLIAAAAIIGLSSSPVNG